MPGLQATHKPHLLRNLVAVLLGELREAPPNCRNAEGRRASVSSVLFRERKGNAARHGGRVLPNEFEWSCTAERSLDASLPDWVDVMTMMMTVMMTMMAERELGVGRQKCQ